MKIAVDIRHLVVQQHSGIGRYTIELLRLMPKLSPNDEFILFASGSNTVLSHLPKFHSKNLKIIKREEPNRIISSKLLFTAHTLDDFLDEKPDAWFFPNINIIKTHRPYALTIHDLSFELFPQFFTLKDRLWHKASHIRKLAQNADVIFAVSDNTKNNIVSHLGVSYDKITTTPLGVNDEFKPYEQPCDQNYLGLYNIDFQYILSLCTMEPRKNIETIVEAYEIWRESCPDTKLHLIIAGARGWKNSKLYKIISNSKYLKDIHVLGYLPEKHKPTLLRHAQLFIFPSFFEGFGLPIVEALASGVQVISSFAGSMQEVGKEHVIYIDPYNVSDLVSAFGVAHKRDTDAFILPSNIFSWESTARRTLGVLHKITQHRTG